MYDTEKYGSIINGPGTYEQLAFDLLERGHVVLNWTDERGTLYNILLSYAPTRMGTPGGIVDSAGFKLWIGIAGKGMFGFSLSKGHLAPVYIAEKLGLSNAVTAAKVAELINGAQHKLIEEMGARVDAFVSIPGLE